MTEPLTEKQRVAMEALEGPRLAGVPWKKRLRHLLTIWRGVSSRAAISSFSKPAAAYSTILARTTSRYGDVYRRAQASSCARSVGDSRIRNGHFLGMLRTPSLARVPSEGCRCRFYTSPYLWR